MIHTPLIVAVAIGMHTWPIPEGFKFCLLSVVGIAGSYGLAILSHRTLKMMRNAREARTVTTVLISPHWQVAPVPGSQHNVEAERGR